MRGKDSRTTASVISAFLSLAIVACGCAGSGGSAATPKPTLSPTATPTSVALCPEAFPPLIAASDPAKAQAASASSSALSSCQVDGSRDVVIGSQGCGPNVYVDQSFTGSNAFGTITINSGGILYFPDSKSLTLSTSGIMVNKGGALEVGTAACPIGDVYEGIGAQVTIIFTGNPPQAAIPKGITVASGGSLSMYGVKGTPLNATSDLSWSYLAAPAGPQTPGAQAPVPTGGATTIQVAGKLDWQASDWIVVAPTDFTPDAGEFVQIVAPPSYNAGTNITTIQLVQSLKTYHFGGPAPDNTLDNPQCKDADGNLLPASFCQSPIHNYGVDERAEVGLVTRSIKLTSPQLTSNQKDLPFWQPGTAYSSGQIIQAQALSNSGQVATYQFSASTGTSGTTMPTFPTSGTVSDGGVTWTNTGQIDLHWGGEITVAGGAAFQIEGVEIENFGKDNTGSYPISVTGATTPPSNPTDAGDIAFNTIHHSFNHGIVLGTASGSAPPKGLNVNGNVVARAVGHLYDLADGTATNIIFNNNLGVGAMEYNFSTCNAGTTPAPCGLTAAQLKARGIFWVGDNLAPTNGYDGYNIPFTDPPSGTYAQAPVSGFYVTNISAALTGNSIAGCQGNGNGVLYLPATATQTGPVATFSNNRLHGCYVGLDASFGLSPGYSGNLQTLQPKDSNGLDQLTTFNLLTATRNRYFGAWMRPNYYVVNNSRFATNRESIALVSGGGPESSPAGEWGLLENSVVVGESQNNPSRWGPCPVAPTQTPASPWGNDGLHGCDGDDYAGRGFPQPYWNEYGYMFYDGPARLENNRMVNFMQNISGELTQADATFLSNYTATAMMPGANANNSTGVSLPFVYEGDAAFGWFQSNVNNYPPTQYSENMIFENVDLRHQVYTQEVNQGPFVDGDKGTVILDHDWSLTGYYVVDSSGDQIKTTSPVSLNNLPFLGTPNSVDECGATGPQDEAFEGRATSLISPQDYATLEVNALTPQSNLNQFYFTKDQKDYPNVQQYDVDNLGPPNPSSNPTGLELVPCAPGHSCLSLAGRNMTGAYEPKVINGLGYTMQSNKGFPAFMDLGLVDASAAKGISSNNPFSVRLGICYQTMKGTAPTGAAAFTVKYGHKSWTNTGGNLPLGCNPRIPTDCLFEQLTNCQGLDFTNPSNLTTCPAAPAGGSVQTLTGVAVTNTNPLPAALDPTKFYYDAANGLLFIQVQQTEENAVGESPLGNPGCNGSTSPPCLSSGETLYSCPADGCGLYTITAGGGYAPSGPTTCMPYGGATDYSQAYPANMNQLAYSTGSHTGQSVQPFITAEDGMSFPTRLSTPPTQQFPHNVDSNSKGICTFN